MKLSDLFFRKHLTFTAAALVFFIWGLNLGWADAGKNILTISAYSSSGEISESGDKIGFVLKIQVHDNWHIHSNKPNEEYLIASRLSLAGYKDLFSLENISYPEPREYYFAFSDKPVSAFDGEFYISGFIALKKDVGPGHYKIPLEFSYQGCTDSACSAPETQTVDIKLEIDTPGKTHLPTGDTSFNNLSEKATTPGIDSGPDSENSFFSRLASSGLAVSLFLVFLGGLGLNLTPCVYPIIPITISYFGAQSEGRTPKLFALGVVYVAGMAVTYSVIGVVSAFSGAFFGGLLQQPAVILGISAIFVFLALGMFGFYDFKLPDSIVARASGSRTGVTGALLMGLTMGIIAAPCIGPLVLGLVAYVAAVGDPVYGFLLFFFLALGLGSPYLLLALFAGKIKNLPRSGEWMEGVKHIFGLILLAMAVYFVSPLLFPAVSDIALPVFGIGAAFYILIFDRSGNSVRGFKYLKTGFAFVVLAVCLIGLFPSESQKDRWPAFSDTAYQQALAENKKIILVFHADWCIPCKELDKMTFSTPEVRKAFDDFSIFQIDLTGTAGKVADKARRRFDVQGVPTIIIIDDNGNEADRITGFINSREMIQKLSRFK